MRISTKKLVLMSLFFAIGVILPFLTGQIPAVGSRLLPMHIPVLLTGFICGAPYGLLVGFILPLFRSLVYSMPPMYPTAIAMAFELATYGLCAGLFMKILPKKRLFIILNLLFSMIIGRIIWGIVTFALLNLNGNGFTWAAFMAGAFWNAIPGILVQLILIPTIVITLIQGKVIDYDH